MVEVRHLQVSATPRSLREDAEQVLDAEEAARARAFRYAEDATRYRTAHVVLRMLLADYLGQEPAAVAINAAPCHHCSALHGKPTTGLPGHEFSLSHAGDVVSYAFARAPVGIDVEVVGPAAGVIDQLHPAERRALRALPAADLPEAASRCWVRKEAYLKGTGVGLGDGLAGVYVGLGPASPDLGGWTLIDLAMPSGYSAALAARAAGTVEARWLFSGHDDPQS